MIEGGASEAWADVERCRSPAGPARWRVDLRRPDAVNEAEVSAWRALLTRIRVAEPFYADPDYLLTAAQHQAGTVDLILAFVWATVDDRDRLQGVVPLAMPHRLWGHGRVALWQPPGTTVVPSIDPGASQEVHGALLLHLRGLQSNATLALSPPAERPSAFERALAPLRLARSSIGARACVPRENLVGIRSAGAPPRPVREFEHVTDPLRLRDAVETFLSLDARVSAEPIVDDPSRAAMVRVVMRRFAERRLASVELGRRDGTIVAAKLRLGVGPRAV
ncbi:MAG TPA: hypothetical protein VF641_02680, partial [Methylobacterium sp.]